MKPKVTDNQRRTMGVREPVKLLWRCKHYSRTQGIDIRDGGSAIRQLSVT